MLTPGLSGLPEPQLVLTMDDVLGTALAVDLTGMGAGAVVLDLTPGTPVEDVTQSLQVDGAAVSLLQELALRRDLFLQDARGGERRHVHS